MDKCEKPMTSTVGNGETVDVMSQTEFKFRSPKRKERRWTMTFYVLKAYLMRYPGKRVLERK
jgi:hypothetical protein